MAARLYYDDAYLTEFDARVKLRGEDGRRIYLDRSAFYPASGGQPFDTGTLNGVAVTEVIDEGEVTRALLSVSFTGDDGEQWESAFAAEIAASYPGGA